MSTQVGELVESELDAGKPELEKNDEAPGTNARKLAKHLRSKLVMPPTALQGNFLTVYAEAAV